MVQTGVAEKLATGLLHAVGDAGPHALLVGLFVLTAVLGQLISNMATALIVIPIGSPLRLISACPRARCS